MSKGDPRSVSINVSFPASGADFEKAVNTSTLLVYDCGHNKQCELMGIMAWISFGVLEQIYDVLCSYCIKKVLQRAFQTEMDEIAAEVDMRAEAPKVKKKKTLVSIPRSCSTSDTETTLPNLFLPN
jgi:hypothetical protein